MRCACSRSRSGFSASSASISPTSSRWRPGGEVRVDRELRGGEPQLLEPADLRDGERLVGDVRERIAAEQRERLARRARRALGRGRARRLGDQPLEAAHVDQLAVDPQLVAAPARDDLRSALAGQRAAQPPDVVLHHLGRARRRLVAPQALDQPVRRHRSVGLEPEHRQHRALLRPADRDGLVVDAGLERPEDADVHGAARVVVLARDQPNHLRGVGINGHGTR